MVRDSLAMVSRPSIPGTASRSYLSGNKSMPGSSTSFESVLSVKTVSGSQSSSYVGVNLPATHWKVVDIGVPTSKSRNHHELIKAANFSNGLDSLIPREVFSATPAFIKRASPKSLRIHRIPSSI